MHYKAQEVKGMKAAEVRNIICDYIEAVQPNFDGVVVTETLIKVVRAKSTDASPSAKRFMEQERLIAEETKDYRIHDMILYLRQVDRSVKKGKIAI